MRARYIFEISEPKTQFQGWFGMAEGENGFCTFRSSTTYLADEVYLLPQMKYYSYST